MLFDDILQGAEGRFADGWRRMGARLEANHDELDRIVAKQKRDVEELHERGRESKRALDQRYEEQEARMAKCEHAFEAHMLDVDKTLSSLRAERRRALEGKVSVAKRNKDAKQKGMEYVEK